MRRIAALCSGLFGIVAAAAAAPPSHPVLFVTQVPTGYDFVNMTISAPFANHLPTTLAAPRGGDLMLLSTSGTLRYLTLEAGYGSNGGGTLLTGNQAIAVRNPAVSFDATKAIFSMVVGAPPSVGGAENYVWQLYEITNLPQVLTGSVPTISKVANQPAFNNIEPNYLSDGSIVFVSDRPRNGASNLYPIFDEYRGQPANSGLWRLEKMLEQDPSLLSQVRSIAEDALHRANGTRFFSLRADFEGYSEDDRFFQKVQLLRRAGLLGMRAAEVERVIDGAVLDLKLASSGELGIVTGFLGLASVIEDGSLIFIDEPEISLHPEWQTRYIDLLLKTFGNFGGCYFALATHSPLILSDIAPENSNVVSLDPNRREAEDAEAFAGRSADYLLVAAFQVPGKNNLYIKQEIIKALRLAANGKAATNEFANILEGLVVLLPQMEEDSPVAELIRELQEAAEASMAIQ